MAEPTGGDPFLEGMDAFGRGVPLDACPYSDGTDERELWVSGWDEAKRMNEDRDAPDKP
jgi:ribosome modulation factor